MKIRTIGLGGIATSYPNLVRLRRTREFIDHAFADKRMSLPPPWALTVAATWKTSMAFESLPASMRRWPKNRTSPSYAIPATCMSGRPWHASKRGATCLLKSHCQILAGTTELVRAVEERKRIAMVGYQLRFHPCLRKLTEIVNSGVLGNLLGIAPLLGNISRAGILMQDYRQMYAARADLGGGVVLSQIHEFDFLYSLFGLPERVYAIGGHWSELEIDVEDTASILMECSIDGRPLPIQLHQDYLQSPPSRQCEVIGERGRAVMDLHALSVTVYTRGNATPTVHSFAGFERNQLFVDQTSHFLECVKTRSRPVVDLKDGLQSLRMALAVKRSIATHLPVELASIE